MNLEISYNSSSYKLNDLTNHTLVTEYRTREDKGKFIDTITVAAIGNNSEKMEVLENLGYYSELSELQHEIDIPKLYLIREIDTISRRAEIYKISLIYKPETMDLLLRSSPEVTLEITRGVWEDKDIDVLYLQRPDQSESSDDWIDLWNVHDGGRYNYVFIDPNSKSNSYPAPIELQIRNNSSTTPNTILITCSDEAIEAPYHVLEAENATGGTIKPLTPDINLYSNGYYSEVNITTTKSVVLTWTLSGSQLALLRGIPFALWLRPSSLIPSGIHLQAQLETNGVLVAETSTIIAGGTEDIFELGTLLIPNLNRYALSNTPDDYNLELYAWGSATTIDIDYLELVPYKYGYRKISIGGTNFGQNQILTLSEVENIAYLSNTGLVSNPLVVFGTPIMVPPHCTPVLYFKVLGSTLPITQSISVKATYRGRYVL